MNGYNPHKKWKLGFLNINAAPANTGGGNLTPANSKVIGPDQTKVGSLRMPQGAEVDLPRNLYAPAGSQSLELSATAAIPALTTVTLFTFTCPQGTVGQILGYAFNSAAPGLISFTPTVNGFRVFPFHGDPSSQFLIFTPTGPDLGNNSVIPAQLPLKPGDILGATVTNADIVPRAAAVRVSGYLISTIQFQDTRFGG
jgi:hypothetical protein